MNLPNAALALFAGTTLLLAPSSPAALIDGLVEYWALDGNYNATVNEAHGGSLQATGTGLTESGFVPGKFGEAIDLECGDANNQASVVIGGDENDFDFVGGSMSMSAWYTTESLYTVWQTLVGKGENSNWRVARNNNSASDLKLYLTIIGNGKLNLQDGSWHHVVATIDAVSGNRLYVDGTLVASNATPSNLTGSPVPMQIGGNPQAASRGWDGMIDDVGIWNRALTAEEVASLWNEGAGASIGSLIGVGSMPFAITAFEYNPSDHMVALTWNSSPGVFYAVKYSTDMTHWDAELDDSILAADPGESTTYSFNLDDLGLADNPNLFFRVEK